MSKADFADFILSCPKSDETFRGTLADHITDGRILSPIRSESDLLRFMCSPTSKKVKDELSEVWDEYLYFLDCKKIQEQI